MPASPSKRRTSRWCCVDSASRKSIARGDPSRAARTAGSFESKSRSGFSASFRRSSSPKPPERVARYAWRALPKSSLDFAVPTEFKAAASPVKPRAPRNAKSIVRISTSAAGPGAPSAGPRRPGLPRAAPAAPPVPAARGALVPERGPGVPDPQGHRPGGGAVLDARAHATRRVLGAQRQRASLAVEERVHLLVDDVGGL